MQEAIKGRSLGEAEVKEIFQISTLDINKNNLIKYFAFTSKNKPKYCPQDYFILPADKLYNKKAETTTVGRYIFNKFLLTNKLGPMLGYMNEPMSDKRIGKLQNQMAQLFLEDKITAEEMREFTDKLNWLSFTLSRILNASLSADFVMTNPKIEKDKKFLLDKNRNEIDNGNMKVVADIENELITEAKEIFKDNPAMQIYNSGCRGSFGNNYKNTSIMRGIVKDFADPTKSYVSTTNLDEGIKPEEFKYYCDMSISGTYGKAIETQDGKFVNCHL